MNKLTVPCTYGGKGCTRCGGGGYVKHGWINPARGVRSTKPKLNAVLCRLCGNEYVQIDKHINKRHSQQMQELIDWLGIDSPTVQRLQDEEKRAAKRATKMANSVPLIQCPLCKSQVAERNLTEHILIQHPLAKYKNPF